MKNTFFKTFILISLINNFISCHAQQVFPLNTFIDDIPANAHVKDLNNELNPYIGTYKSNFEGKEIILFIEKVENRLIKYTDQQFYRDALVIKYIVKNSSGQVLQDTKNNNLPNIELYSTKIRGYDNSVILYYSGTNCGIGWGSVFIKKLNATQISWDYRPQYTILLPGDCPGNPDLNIYLPESADPIIFTKQ